MLIAGFEQSNGTSEITPLIYLVHYSWLVHIMSQIFWLSEKHAADMQEFLQQFRTNLSSLKDISEEKGCYDMGAICVVASFSGELMERTLCWETVCYERK